ncbi:MAG: oligosaccharide flippase family protein [Halieaceae bacterium]
MKIGVAIFLGLCVSKLVNFLSQLLLTNSLSVETFGFYSLIITTFSILAVVSSAGLHNGVIRYLSIESVERKISRNVLSIYHKVLFVGLILSCASSVSLALIAESISVFLIGNEGLSQSLKICFVALPFSAVLMISSYFMRARQVFWPEVLIRNILRSVVFLSSVGLLLLLGLSADEALFVAALVLSYVIASILSLLAPMVYFRRVGAEKSPIFRISEFFKFSIYSILILVFYEGLLGSDKYAIAILMDDANALGLYSGASMVARQTEVFSIVILTIIAPKIASFPEFSDKLYNYVKTISIQIFPLAVALMIAVTAASPFILGLLGPSYLEARIEFLVLSLGFIFSSIITPVGAALQYTSGIRYEIFIMLLVMIVNLLLLYPAITFFGTLGAAISTTFALFLVGVMRSLSLQYLAR